jgi:hypothetical protein
MLMNFNIAKVGVALFLFAAAVGLTAAQDNKKTTHKDTRTLTGCLQKAEDAGEYNLTTNEGGTWEVKSDSVKLAPHVGHTVKIEGVVSNASAHGAKEDMKDEMKEHGMDKNMAEHGHLTATELTMVSETCSK